MERNDWKTNDGKNVLDLQNPLENRLKEVKRGRLVIDKNDIETTFLIDSLVENHQRTIKLNPNSKLNGVQQVYHALSRGNNADYNVVVVNDIQFERDMETKQVSAIPDYDLHQVYVNQKV